MFWMTKKMPDKTAGYLLCTIRWGETRLTHEYYWGPDPKNRFRWWVSKEACQANLPDGGFEDSGYEIVAWARMPEPYRKEMYESKRNNIAAFERRNEQRHGAAERNSKAGRHCCAECKNARWNTNNSKRGN